MINIVNDNISWIYCNTWAGHTFQWTVSAARKISTAMMTIMLTAIMISYSTLCVSVYCLYVWCPRVCIHVCLWWCWQQWWFMTGWETFIVPLSARPHNSMQAKCGNIRLHNIIVLCHLFMIFKDFFVDWCWDSFVKSVAKTNFVNIHGHCFNVIQYTFIFILKILCPEN